MTEEGDRTICLDQFLKYIGLAETGGQAKLMIQQSMVRVNGDIETRRRRKLVHGDVVEAEGEPFSVEFSDEEIT